MPEYSADPALQDAPLNPAEIEAYAADPSAFARDPRKVGHLLRRVLATVMMYKSQIQSLNRDVQDIQMSRARTGAATTMSPRDAVRFLSPQELAGVVEGTHRALLEHVLGLQTEAKRARRDAVSEQNKARFVVLSLMEDPAIPVEVRERLAATLAALPPEHFAPEPGEAVGVVTGANGVVAAETDLVGTAGAAAGAHHEVVAGGGLEDLFAESEGSGA